MRMTLPTTSSECLPRCFHSIFARFGDFAVWHETKCFWHETHIPMDIRLDSFLDILHSNVPCRILLCNDSKIIASKNYHTALNMPVTESIQRLLQQGKMKLFSEKERIYPTMTGKYPISVFFPISKKDEFGETLGLLLCAKNQQPFSEMDLGCAKMTAAAISRYIQQNYERKVT